MRSVMPQIGWEKGRQAIPACRPWGLPSHCCCTEAPARAERCKGHPESFLDLFGLKAKDRSRRRQGDERRHRDRRNAGVGDGRLAACRAPCGRQRIDSHFFRGFAHRRVDEVCVPFLRPTAGKCKMP